MMGSHVLCEDSSSGNVTGGWAEPLSSCHVESFVHVDFLAEETRVDVQQEKKNNWILAAFQSDRFREEIQMEIVSRFPKKL